MTPPEIAVGITTVGRWAALQELLGDLAAQSLPPAQVVVVHPGLPDAGEAIRDIRRRLGASLPLTVLESALGASNGRNAVLSVVSPDVDYLHFPNDTSRLPETFYEEISNADDAADFLVLPMVDDEGRRNRVPEPGTTLTPASAWGAIEPATLIRSSVLRDLDGFDPGIGTGASSPWQSGEITDVLLRALRTRPAVSVSWRAAPVVRARLEFGGASPGERRRKLRAYGRGTGFLYRRWQYPRLAKARLLAGALSVSLRLPGRFGAADALLLALGRVEGLLGRELGRSLVYRAAR